MHRTTAPFCVGLLVTVLLSGCSGSAGLFDRDAELASVASAKAVDVAENIGGTYGFGGHMMDGYLGHVGPGMGFVTVDDLSDPDGVLTVRLQNQTDQSATFHLSYFAVHYDLDDHLQDIVVPSGGEVTVEIRCAEIVGLGNLEMPGAMGCHLPDGERVDNTFAVPMFHGLDFACGDTITFALAPDIDDLDADGDEAELILLSEGFVSHFDNDGPLGHSHMGGMMHGGFGGMMGFGSGRR